MNKKNFRGVFVKFINKTSSVVPEKKDGKEIYPKVKLRVWISNAIPPTHRICRWWLYQIKPWQQQLTEELCFILSCLLFV